MTDKSWLYSKSADELAAELEVAEAELTALREELSRERLAYQSLADHAEVHERELMAEIAALKGLLRRAVKIINGFSTFTLLPAHIPSFKAVYDKAQVLLPDLEAALSEKP